VSIRRFALVAMVVVVGIAVVAVAAVGRGWVSHPALGAVPSAAAVAASSPVTSTPPPAPTVFDTGMTAPHGNDAGLWMSWSLVDNTDGRRVGSANSTTERTNSESSIKAWITTDFLRIAGQKGRTLQAGDRATIDAAIRKSDDQAAQRLYLRLGGDEVLRDLKTVCGVGVSTARRGYWSYTQITAADATTILDCVLDKAPTYPGGDEIVADLHDVAADNAFGIPQALPAGTKFAVKNGWTAHSATGKWNVDCVASWDHYTLAVLTRYPMARKLDYGATVCRDVTATVLKKLG
jgi:hypothetical protein